MSNTLETLIAALITLIGLGLIFLLGGIVFQLLSLPFMRQERAQLFVNLLEQELKRGHDPEQAILRLSRCQDASLSVRFFILAAHLERGLTLPEALERVPRFLPAGVTAIIQTGCRLGKLLELLPACRYQLRSATDQVTKARNYLALTIMVFLPAWIAAVWLIGTFVLPRFRSIAHEIAEGGQANWAVEHFDTMLWLTAIPVSFLLISVIAFAIGPRLRLWCMKVLPAAWVDRVGILQPWSQCRARRDFSLALARLLDGGVNEPDAVRFAGSASGNRYYEAVGREIADDLKQGGRLPDALSRIDPAKEFQWRWRMAAHTGLPFETALAGWHEVLHDRAVKTETTMSTFYSSLLIVINGLIVGIVVVGIFQFLTGIIQEATLW